MRVYLFYITLAVVLLFVWDSWINYGHLSEWLSTYVADSMNAFGLD